MSDQKISQLVDGVPAEAGDLLVVARGGDNFRVTAQSVAALGGGGGGFGPSVDNTFTTVFGTLGAGNLNAVSANWEYTGANNTYVSNASAGLTRGAAGDVVARTTTDVCSQKMLATFSLFAPGGLSSSSSHRLCVGVPSTALGSFDNRYYLYAGLGGSTDVSASVGLINSVGGNVTLVTVSGLGGTTLGTSHIVQLRIDGGRLRLYHAPNNAPSGTTLIAETSLPTQFFGPDGTIFPLGRRGGVLTDTVNTTTQLQIGSATFETFDL